MLPDEEKPSLLIVDDDDIILIALRESIAAEGYQIVSTTRPQEALDYVKKQNFSVIISDQRMPGMTGLEFFSEVKNIQPDATRILITGVLTLKTVIDAVNKGEIFRFLAKPWIREELLVTIKNAVQRYQLLQTNKRLQADMLKLNERLSYANLELQKHIQELLKKDNELLQSHEALKNNFQRSLQLCFNIISTSHPTLGKQTKMTVDICRLMLESGLIEKEEQYTLSVSSWLYNIGLLSISRELVNKSQCQWESLTNEERLLIKSHPKYGQTLASFVEDLADVGNTIRAHHEHWDGSGYPDGLMGEDIPKAARYLAVASYYVESDLPQDEAIEDILKKSGTYFDPEAVRLFLKVTRLIHVPKKVKELLLSELREGMVLAKGIYNQTGLLLIPEGQILDAPTLQKIQEHNLFGSINDRILIYE